MTPRSLSVGHDVEFVNGKWRFIDTKKSVYKPRDCAHCGKKEQEQEVTIPDFCSHTKKEYQKLVLIDNCIAPLIKELNKFGLKTIGCCCGHGGPGYLQLKAENISTIISDKNTVTIKFNVHPK